MTRQASAAPVGTWLRARARAWLGACKQQCALALDMQSARARRRSRARETHAGGAAAARRAHVRVRGVDLGDEVLQQCALVTRELDLQLALRVGDLLLEVPRPDLPVKLAEDREGGQAAAAVRGRARARGERGGGVVAVQANTL